MVCVSLCPALLTEACVFEAPGGHTELLLSAVHTCTTIAVMQAKTGTDKIITHTHTFYSLQLFPTPPPLLREPLCCDSASFDAEQKVVYVSHVLDLLECKGRISISPQ